MRSMKGRMVLLVSIAAAFFIGATAPAAGTELGFAGINDYESGPEDCEHGSRCGRFFVTYLRDVDDQVSPQPEAF